MVFSSVIFIFFFLPVTLAGFYILPVKWKDIWLLVLSLLFYYWGGSAFFPIIVYSILLNYFGGLLLNQFMQKPGRKGAKAVFWIIVLMNLGSLGYWKYAGFFMEAVNGLSGLGLPVPEIVLPIGISFFTFQSMSYVIDLYRGEVPVQKSLIRLGLYITMFPQLIAGPIVRYSDIEKQLEYRKCNVDVFSEGIRIFAVGLAKKAILANSVALTADRIFGMNSAQNIPSVAWLGLICYTFQLYFDFAGYSDMAIGLGKMFGFTFMKNFDYPYISRSMTEFWRRWHISLSTWFRDYVYIPLGGNRTGHVYRNLFIVFLLTGIWHGASWNFVIWGVYLGIVIVLERVWREKIVPWLPECLTCSSWYRKKIKNVVSWMATMFLWMMSMVFFRAATLESAVEYMRSLFGWIRLQNAAYSLPYYLHTYEIVMLLICFAAMLPIGKMGYLQMKKRISEGLFSVVQNGAALLLLGISILYVVTGTYNPFIYFQF